MVFCNPAYLPLVYHRNADKGPSYLAASGFGLVAIPSHRHHAAHRRRLQPPFSVSAVKKSTPLIEACVESWVQALLQQTPGSDSSNTSGNEIDFTYWPSYLTYDTLSELCFGSKFGMIEQRRDVNRLIGGLEDCLVMVGALIRWPSVVKWAERLGMGWLGFFDCTENTPGIGSVCKVSLF